MNRHRITQNPKIMKTIKLLLLIMVALSVACMGCSKLEDENAGTLQQKIAPATNLPENEYLGNVMWKDGFDSPFALANNWTLYGNPQPQWVQSAFGKTGLFDNNGPSPIRNYAVSELIIGKGCGYTLESEVMLKITNLEGDCVCPGIGISKDLNPIMKNGEIETGVSMRMIFVGSNSTTFPQKYKGHTWIIMTYLPANGEYTPLTVMADSYSNSWHILKIEVTPANLLKFYIDNNLLWAPSLHADQSIINNKNVVLGYTSSGNPATVAGKAYHDWIKVTNYIGPGIN
jgi:hypothetical protein